MSKTNTTNTRDTAEAADMLDTIDTMDIFDLMDLLETMNKADALALLRTLDTTDVLEMLDTMEILDALDTLDTLLTICPGSEAESMQIAYISNKMNDANVEEIAKMLDFLNEMEYPDTMVTAMEIEERLIPLYQRKKAEAEAPLWEALKLLGQTIYNARKAAKMSRAELGRLVGLHESTVKRYEDGNIKSPNMEKVTAFAEVLHLDYQELADWWVPQGHQRMNDSESKQSRLPDTHATSRPAPDNPDAALPQRR